MRKKPTFHQRVKALHDQYRAGEISREEYMELVKAGRFDQVIQSIDKKFERYRRMLDSQADNKAGGKADLPSGHPSNPRENGESLPFFSTLNYPQKTGTDCPGFFWRADFPLRLTGGSIPSPGNRFPGEEAKSALTLPERRTALTTCETHKRWFQVVPIGRSAETVSEHSFSSRAQCRALSPFVSLFMVIFIKNGVSESPPGPGSSVSSSLQVCKTESFSP